MKNVQKATPEDIAQVKSLNALLRIDVQDFYWDSDDYIRSAIAEERCYVVKETDMIKGAMIIERRGPDPTWPSPCFAIGILTVFPEDREKGLGTHLMEAAKALAFKEDKRLYVECFFEYENLDYYKKIGFREDSVKEYNGKPYHVLFLDPKNIPCFPSEKRIDIGDRLEYLSYLEKMPVVPSDVTFENLLVYDSPQRQISLSIIHNNVLVITRRPEGTRLYPPAGNDSLDETIVDSLEWLRKEPENSGFTCVPCETADSLKPATKEKLAIVEDRDSFDYLYDPDYHFFKGANLRTLRQNLTHFLDKGSGYRDLTYDMVTEVRDFQLQWMEAYTSRMNKTGQPVSDFIAAENAAILKALAHCKSLNLTIGAVYVNSRMKGFSIAGLFRRTAYIHFEKAVRDRGAYQALVHLFSRAALQGIDRVNKEQDLGISGLRTSKERYQPSGFIEKCNIAFKTELHEM